jgi:23S rRNA (uridine2552-2'-O)-methyltransferase
MTSKKVATSKKTLKKNKIVKEWVHRQANDPYVKLAKKLKFRTRAAFKLIEIDKEFGILKNVKLCVDLGCAPGGFSQVLTQKIENQGKVIGVDLLETLPMPGLTFIQGDFTREETLKRLTEALNHQRADIVVSDMAPNLTGIKLVDQASMKYLVELVLEFCKEYLKPQGNCLIKVFNGLEFNELVKEARTIFNKVIIHKPKSSRSESSEVYLLLLALKENNNL